MQCGTVQGCNAPLMVGAPIDLKLYGLNVVVFHAPLMSVNVSQTKTRVLLKTHLASISAVKSVSSLTNSRANFGPLLNL
jgi:hypothetical protein